MMACSDDVVSLLRSPLVGHTIGRERWRKGWRTRRRGGLKAHVVVCLSLLLGPLYIVGRGSTNPSTKAAKGGGQGGEATTKVEPSRAPPKP
jgi:hypothetical protein